PGPVADRAGASGVDAGEVAFDQVVRGRRDQGADDVDAVDGVAGSHVARFGRGAADRVMIRRLDANAVDAVGLGHGALGVGADEVARDTVEAGQQVDASGREAIDRQALDGGVVAGADAEVVAGAGYQMDCGRQALLQCLDPRPEVRYAAPLAGPPLDNRGLATEPPVPRREGHGVAPW